MNFILQPNSLFARHLQCTKVVTLNPCKRSWITTWTWKIQTAPEMTFLGLNQPPIFYSEEVHSRVQLRGPSLFSFRKLNQPFW